MILVDTSVWIRFISNRPPYTAELDRLLALDDVSGHELVYGELLIGDRGGRRELLSAYHRIHQTKSIPHRDVVDFISERKLYGRGVGWTDIHLIASAIVSRSPIWTADVRLAAVASELGIAYQFPFPNRLR